MLNKIERTPDVTIQDLQEEIRTHESLKQNARTVRDDREVHAIGRTGVHPRYSQRGNFRQNRTERCTNTLEMAFKEILHGIL